MAFSAPEELACRRLVDMAWEEDLGLPQDPLFGAQPTDLTSQTIIPPDLDGRAVFVARTPGVVAGLPAAELVFGTVHTPLVKVEPLVADGTRVQPGDRLATVRGLMQFILMGERIALNFLQHLSGVATLTRRYVDSVAGLPCQILDTRKTLPGWRLLEKYAVRCGGGHNHRMGLHDAVLIKDNHLAAMATGPKTILAAAETAFRKLGGSVPIEVEVENLKQLEEALWSAARILLLDNMELEDLREAVRLRNERELRIKTDEPPMLLEASGGVTLTTVRAIAETGVDRISVGALTHSAPALDIALDYEKVAISQNLND